MGISPWQLLIILAIVLLLFGTKRLRSMGGDLGEAIKSFKKSVSDEDKKDEDDDPKSVESQKRESAESTEQREDEKNRS